MRRRLALVLVAVAVARSTAADDGGAAVVLERLVERALAESPRLDRARARADASAAAARRARSALLPRLAFEERFTSSDQPSSAFVSLLEQGRIGAESLATIGEPPRVENWAATLSARTTLFDSGRSWAAWSAALDDAARERLESEHVRRKVRFDVAAAFYELLRARARTTVWRDTVRALAARRESVRARVDVGEALGADLATVDVRLAEAREGEITAGWAADVALATLAEAIGVGADEIEVPELALERPEYALALERVLGAALETNPRVLAAGRAREAAEGALRAARRASYPRLLGEVAGRWNGEDETFGLERESYAAGVVLEVPLFEGGLRAAERDEAAARLREVEAAASETRRAIELEARRADRRAREAVAVVAVADEGARAADQILDVLAARYEQGLVPLETLLEIERDRTRARASGVEARAAARVALEAVRLIAGEEAFR